MRLARFKGGEITYKVYPAQESFKPRLDCNGYVLLKGLNVDVEASMA